tara:strand:- start:37 stop:705 length:669 start_codon:yes stop_codon:yes gene_type:complete
MNHTITNAIPVVLRHLKHLDTAISSVLQQTLLPNEIIIIISEYSKDEINDNLLIKIQDEIKKHNISCIIKTFDGRQLSGMNRQIAYDLCSSDIIIFQDCDDWAHKQRNEIFVKTHEKTKSPHILHGWTADQNAKNKDIDINNLIISDRINEVCTHNGAIFINKSIIGQLTFPNPQGGRPPGLGEDKELNNLLKSKCKSIIIENNDIYIYNRHLSSWAKANRL